MIDGTTSSNTSFRSALSQEQPGAPESAAHFTATKLSTSLIDEDLSTSLAINDCLLLPSLQASSCVSSAEAPQAVPTANIRRSEGSKGQRHANCQSGVPPPLSVPCRITCALTDARRKGNFKPARLIAVWPHFLGQTAKNPRLPCLER